MATKRKKKKTKKNQARVPFPALLANVLVLVAVLGLSYMWLCSRCDALGKEIKAREGELATAQKRLVNEQDHWSSITSPGNLSRAINRHGLQMGMPPDRQIVRVGAWDSSGRTAMLGRQ
ncbi:hypothetical protein [Pontiella sulfatireligans]|uniref:Cell division protein FtsL n=1 Tax=Pontiella sulfatireligans TaxID=2750658 RepID=A0A6C2UHJ5_9BACT|nr:hypothetical protein [Pontiella sulfatireligans]VGO19682.1 hypothetical protein SCARR_01741 [Pontiella sulfatireligans]